MQTRTWLIPILTAQPVIGMFPPASLLSGPCAPRTFDFYTASIDELLDFEIPVDFVVGRTGLIHGVSLRFSDFRSGC